MKKLTLSIKINVPDEFEIGDCEKCPIVLKEYKECAYGQGRYKYKCSLGFKPGICPLEEKSSK